MCWECVVIVGMCGSCVAWRPQPGPTLGPLWPPRSIPNPSSLPTVAASHPLVGEEHQLPTLTPVQGLPLPCVPYLFPEASVPCCTGQARAGRPAHLWGPVQLQQRPGAQGLRQGLELAQPLPLQLPDCPDLPGAGQLLDERDWKTEKWPRAPAQAWVYGCRGLPGAAGALPESGRPSSKGSPTS